MGNLIEVSSKSPLQLLEFLSDQKKKISEKLQSHFAGPHRFVETSIMTSVGVKSTILVLHVEKYRRSNGDIPDSLAAIAGSINPAVMTDPYTDGTMLYQKDEKSYTIYSTGPDRVDHGGSVKAQVSQTTGRVEKKPDDLGWQVAVTKEQE